MIEKDYKMAEQKEVEKHVKFIYNRPDDYEIVYVNGVYGGLTPRGDISCNFFHEHFSIPREEEFEINKDGKMGKQILKRSDVQPINRDLKVGIVFKVEDAESIANWILDKVKASRGEKTEPTP